MKIGSLVECVLPFTGDVYNEKLPAKGLIYTVREVESFKEGTGVRLEEIVNEPYPYMMDGRYREEECYFEIKHFRELQEPMTVNILELEEEVI